MNQNEQIFGEHVLNFILKQGGSGVATSKITQGLNLGDAHAQQILRDLKSEGHITALGETHENGIIMVSPTKAGKRYAEKLSNNV